MYWMISKQVFYFRCRPIIVGGLLFLCMLFSAVETNAQGRGGIGRAAQGMGSRMGGSGGGGGSDSLSFEICAKMAYREALRKCKPILLEPIMKLEVVTPEENMGDVVGDLNRRRGMMRGMDDRNGSKVLKADVPLSEMFGYVTQLRTITSGRASSSMEFSHYSEAPKNVAEDVVAKANGKVTA